ncbi:TM2 domain protein [Pseudobythopirellula maris]|uniref:TM2 domain protein n=1 Tax=Pseudobythopirellula maris TaxID=2527991 RepID=A0A5C5ZTB1_9BACT|nr:TM2 domain-containing protein [Pseudobythopirellula maris]TWT90061.1 TM2 domain protein [Pseudobythopirellula maris]
MVTPATPRTATAPPYDANPPHDADLSHAEGGEQSHYLIVGYALWVFGFLGSHRFYYGKPITGTIWFFTLGLLFIGWIIDLFLIPSMQDEASNDAVPGPLNHTIAWLLLTFLGVLGVHRFYMGKWITGIIYFLTIGLFGVGVIYDFWTLNEQVNESNLSHLH